MRKTTRVLVVDDDAAIRQSKKPNISDDPAELRRRAEARLSDQRKGQPSKAGDKQSEADAARGRHELEVHQIELEMQNAELQQARDELEAAVEKYTDLYDFAPVGYLTLDHEGVIREANLAGANLLGIARSALMKKRLGLFVFPADRSVFDAFLQKVFASKVRQGCEVTLKVEGRPPVDVEMEAIVFQSEQACRAVVTDITAHKRAEEGLRQAEQKYRSIVENAMDGIFQSTPEGRFRSANAALARMLGYASPEELIANTADIGRQYFAEPDRCRELRQLLETKESVQGFEVEARRQDGGRIWVSLSAHVVRDPGGAPLYYEGFSEDITERKKAQAVLRASEEKFRALFESAPIGIAIHDASGHYADTNKVYQQMLGYSEEELKRLGAKRATFPDDVAEGQRLFGELRAGTRDSYQREKRYLSRDGRVIWAVSSASAVRDHFGQLQFIISMVENITRRKQAEAALREGEERFRQLAENIREVFWMTDPTKDEMLYVSPAYEEIWGRTCASLLASPRDWLAAIHPEDRGRVQEAALTKQVSGQYREEYRIVRPDGSVRWIQDQAFAVRDAAGAVYRVVGIAEDISERKQAEEQIRLLADAMQSARELICITDEENRFTYANRAFLETYGYTEAEVLGRTPEFLYATANPRGLCSRVYEQTLAGGGWQGEVINCRKDGTEFPLSLSTSLVRNRAGKIIGLVGVARDISERKRAEKQRMAFSHLGHRLSLALAPEDAAKIILEIADELFGWDAAYVHLYSKAADSIIPVLTMDTVDGQRIPVSIDVPTLEPTPLMRLVMARGAQLINRADEAGASVELVPFGDARRRSASRMYVPISANGAGVGILSIQSYKSRVYAREDLNLLQALADHCGDALMRIEVTEAMLAAESKYRGIFENATEGIFQTTPEGRCCNINPAAARMLGYQTPEECMSSITDLGRQTYVVPEQREEMKRLLESQGSVQGFEAERYRKDGSKIWMSINAHVVRDSSGAILYYEGASQDITARKLAEAELRRLPQRIIAAQETERLRVARELHDGVNQLLASAKMRLRKVEETIGALSPAAREIIARCNQLLVQALEENRRIAYNLHPSELDELGLAVACKNLCKEFQSRTTLVVKSRMPRNWSRLSPAIELNLFRIVQETFNNVERHAHARTVRLGLAIQGDLVVLRIRDDGRGFDPHASKSAKRQRRGIGLTNMRERAASVGGTCELLSVPKQGTTITVRVPWRDAK